MSALLPGPPMPQTLAPASKSLNEQYDAERQKKYAATPRGQAEVVYKDRRVGQLFKIAIYATVLFFVLSNSVTYNVVNKLFATFTQHANLLIDESGLITLKGNAIHTAVFFVIMMILLFFT